MKAITLTQPWATLVAIGAKRIETRSWATRYRGPLAIHAAKGIERGLKLQVEGLHMRIGELVIERDYEYAARQETQARLDAALLALNTPEILDFVKAVPLEAAHQRERWGSDHDAGKTAADWFWLVGYLAGKALHMHAQGNTEKALHHTISTAAALANWHSAILGKTDMRPGIMPPSQKETV